MKKTISYFAILITGIFMILNLVNCNTPKKTVTATNQPQTAVMEVGGVQLWATNCIRCHNSPPPNAYNDNEWDAIVNHMQKVGGLTVSDADKIADYLKASN